MTDDAPPVLSRVRTRLWDFVLSMDVVSTRLTHVAPNLLVWPLVYAVTLGSGAFIARHMSWVATMDNNKVKLEDSLQMALWIGAALVGLGVFYAVAVAVARRAAARRHAASQGPRAPRPTAGGVLAELHARMRPVLVLPLLEALTFASIERDSPKETLFLITLAGVIAGAAAYAWLRPLPPRPWRQRALSWVAFLVLVLVAFRALPLLDSLAIAASDVVGKLLTQTEPPPAPVTDLAKRLMSPAAFVTRWGLVRALLVLLAGVTAFGGVVGAGLGVVGGLSVEPWLRHVPPLAPEGAGAEGDAPPPARPGRERAAKWAAGLSVAALWAGYGAWFSFYSITNHHALRSAVIDLGLYDNIFWQSAHGHPLGCSFAKMGYHGSAHFDPFLVLLSPLYLLYPHAEFLLVLQAVWLGMGVVPVYLVARHRLDSRPSGVALAAMYAVYPALHGANMYEFHSLTLVAPVALWQLYFLESGRRRAYWALLLPTLLVREDIAILMSFVGVYAILTRRPGWARLGWVTIAVSGIYFAVVKRFFMTSADIFMSGKDSYSFAYYYDDLIPNHNGVAGMLISLLTNPVFVLKTVLGEPKLLYVLTLFVPLAFLPFFARPGRFMLTWGLAFCLLATRPAVFSTHFQYSCIIIPVAFAVVPEALRQIEDGAFVRARGLDGLRLRHALLAAALVTSLLTSWKFGGLVENATFHGGFGPPARALTDKDREIYAFIRRETAQIPRDASVGTTNRAGAHVSNRRAVYFYPEHSDVDWLFLDESEVRGADLEKHNKAVQSGVFEQVAKHDRFGVYRRKKAQ